MASRRLPASSSSPCGSEPTGARGQAGSVPVDRGPMGVRRVRPQFRAVAAGSGVGRAADAGGRRCQRARCRLRSRGGARQCGTALPRAPRRRTPTPTAGQPRTRAALGPQSGPGLVFAPPVTPARCSWRHRRRAPPARPPFGDRARFPGAGAPRATRSHPHRWAGVEAPRGMHVLRRLLGRTLLPVELSVPVRGQVARRLGWVRAAGSGTPRCVSGAGLHHPCQRNRGQCGRPSAVGPAAGVSWRTPRRC